MPVPNAEQTASIFSLAIYSFLDPIVFLAYRVPHLAHDQLPPLADYDYARHLTEKSFPVRVFFADLANLSYQPRSTLTPMLVLRSGMSSSDSCMFSERNIQSLRCPSFYKSLLALSAQWASSNYLGLFLLYPLIS